MIKSLLSSDSGFRILIQHFANKIFGIGTNIFPFIKTEFKWLIISIIEYFSFIISTERGISTQHNKENDSKTPDITFFAIWLFKYFRGHIVRSTYDLAELFTFFDSDSCTEINDFYIGECFVIYFYMIK